MFHPLLTAYNLHATTDPKPIGNGLINKTFLVETTEGAFVIQQIHNVIPDAAVEDMRTVTTFLSEKDFVVPNLRPCENGAWFYRDADGTRWRVYPFLPGKVVDTIVDADMAQAAGKMIGKMHATLKEFSYRPQGSIPHFHDTAFILNEFLREKDHLPDVVQPHVDMILRDLPALIEQIERQPKQLIHGDLKISNILFDESHQAIGVIDFDTILYHSALVDTGDAYRSWCNKTTEDDPLATFDTQLFDAAFGGYEEGSGQKADRSLHLVAAKMITLELATRFLIDVVRDNYFGFDAAKYKTRKEANIARAIGQVHLAETIFV